MLADDFLDAVHDLDGACLRGRIGELHVDDEIALVLIGNEAAGDHGVTEVGEAEQPDVDEQDDGAEPQAPGNRSAIEASGLVEDSVEAAKEIAEPPVDWANDDPAHDAA